MNNTNFGVETSELCVYETEDTLIITLNGKVLLETYKEKTNSVNCLDFRDLFREMAEAEDYYYNEYNEDFDDYEC